MSSLLEGVFVVPKGYPAIDVDGVTIAREMFTWLSNVANTGRTFHLRKTGMNQVVELEELKITIEPLGTGSLSNPGEYLATITAKDILEGKYSADEVADAFRVPRDAFRAALKEQLRML